MARLPIHYKVRRRLAKLGIKELYPPQLEAVRAGHKGNNLLVTIPTASGKTLVAELLLVHRLLHAQDAGKRAKALYLCPLKALAAEKFHQFKAHWEPLGLTIALSTGDLDQREAPLQHSDVIILTNEKADSLVRGAVDWIQHVRVVVADEIHLLTDPDRGPTLEIVLARFRELLDEVQVIGLSATIANAAEVAAWLNATLVQSNWRPVPLREGTAHKNKIILGDADPIELPLAGSGSTLECVVNETLQDRAQVLVFAPTRRTSKSTAAKLRVLLKSVLSNAELQDLERKSATLQKLNYSASSELDELAENVKFGLAFHHAGLPGRFRALVEQWFREGTLRVITATPTLAAGINIPARRVLIQSLRRYDPERGRSFFIPVIEYKQMAGRAGRPGFDAEGESLILARDFHQARRLRKRYVHADPEPITSKLARGKRLSKHILGTITGGFHCTRDSLLHFFHHTFFGHQRGLDSDRTPKETRDKRNTPSRHELMALMPKLEISDVEKLAEIKKTSRAIRRRPTTHSLSELMSAELQGLVDGGFVRATEETYEATPLGVLTARLYIEPKTATEFRRAIQVIRARGDAGTLKLSPLSFLHVIARTPECHRPVVSPREISPLATQLQAREREFLLEALPSAENAAVFEEELEAFKYALVLERWINEAPESRLETDHHVLPGDLHRYAESARWLLHCLRRLLTVLGEPALRQTLEDLETRVKYGIKDELVDLVRIQGIGRVRARLLAKHGYKTLAALARISPEELNAIPGFGPQLIASIFSQLDREIVPTANLGPERAILAPRDPPPENPATPTEERETGPKKNQLTLDLFSKIE